MTNAEIIQAIKAEIERRMKELDEQIVDIYDSKAVLRKDELQRLLSFISTKEIEKDIAEEAAISGNYHEFLEFLDELTYKQLTLTEIYNKISEKIMELKKDKK